MQKNTSLDNPWVFINKSSWHFPSRWCFIIDGSLPTFILISFSSWEFYNSWLTEKETEAQKNNIKSPLQLAQLLHVKGAAPCHCVAPALSDRSSLPSYILETKGKSGQVKCELKGVFGKLVGWCFAGANEWRSVFLRWTQGKEHLAEADTEEMMFY